MESERHALCTSCLDQRVAVFKGNSWDCNRLNCNRLGQAPELPRLLCNGLNCKQFNCSLLNCSVFKPIKGCLCVQRSLSAVSIGYSKQFSCRAEKRKRCAPTGLIGELPFQFRAFVVKRQADAGLLGSFSSEPVGLRGSLIP